MALVKILWASLITISQTCNRGLIILYLFDLCCFIYARKKGLKIHPPHRKIRKRDSEEYRVSETNRLYKRKIDVVLSYM